MPAFIPILYRMDNSYILPVNISRPGSKFNDIEFIPREMLDTFIAESKTNGLVVEPVINHGFH